MTEEEFSKVVPQVTFKTRVRDESVGGENPFHRASAAQVFRESPGVKSFDRDDSVPREPGAQIFF